MEVFGIVKQIMPLEKKDSKNGKEIVERKFVVELESNTPFPQKVVFVTRGDKTKLIDNISINDYVKIIFKLKGFDYYDSENQLKYYTYIEAISISKITFEKIK